MEECPVQPLTYTSGSIPRSLGLDSLVFDNLGNIEGPVTIQNLKITGTSTAKEQRSNSTHPYTLYTIKVRFSETCQKLQEDISFNVFNLELKTWNQCIS